ncbi:MAG: putative methylase [Candidatus Nanohaloarchaea archaeon]|jgi:putative methylase
MKAKIAMKLSKLKGFENPKISLEQYMTPPELAADILHSAHMQGDIEGKEVLDLGTGTGIFAIGAALLGAEVTAVDKDEEALEIAKGNAEDAEVSEFIDFIEKDISEVEGKYDTVLMNPPFSVHSDEGMKFLEKALESGENVYSVIYGGRKEAIKDFVANSGHELRAWEEYEISLPATYGFHTEESRDVEVGVLITSKKD